MHKIHWPCHVAIIVCLWILVSTSMAQPLLAESSAAEKARAIPEITRPPPVLLVTVRFGEQNLHSVELATRTYQTNTREQSVQYLRVESGQTAFVETGQQIPYVSGFDVNVLNNGIASIDYKVLTSGFYIKPQLLGDTVRMEVSRQRESLQRDGEGRIAFDRLATTLTIPLDTWVSLGGTVQEDLGYGNRRIYQTQEVQQDWKVTYIKVSVLQP
ncbi:MAG: hypothetical protein Tsb005_10240 [Gammaproteobacteria bacterium]